MKISTALATVALTFALTFAGAASNAATVELPSPTQAQMFAALGASCGGIQAAPTLVGFDTAGYVLVSWYLSTTCSTGGKGGGSHTYAAVTPATYDFVGEIYMGQKNPADPAHASTDGVTATDAGGDVVVLSAPFVAYSVDCGTLTVNAAPPYPTNFYVPMLSVIGDTQAVAVAALTKAGYPSVVNVVSSTVYPAGKVFNQSPAAGTPVDAGQTVTVWVVRKGGG
jgi:hypothetical protein